MKKLVCIALLSGFAAFGDDNQAKPMAPPAPPEQLGAEKWFVGTWSCKGTAQPGAMGPGGPMADTTKFTMDLGGSWLQVKVTPAGGPMKGKEVVDGFAGWDGTQHVRFDFLVGGMAKLTSKGPEGDTIVFEGDRMVGGQKQAMKHTITKKGDSSFESNFEFDGKPAIQETCTKMGAKAAPAKK